VSFHQCCILIHWFIHMLLMLLGMITVDMLCICCDFIILDVAMLLCQRIWREREIPDLCLFQAWKLSTCSLIIHQASGPTEWTSLLIVLQDCGMFKFGMCLQQTSFGDFCNLLGSHSSFSKEREGFRKPYF